MKNNSITYSAFVGIDWADKKHDVSLSAAVGVPPVHQVISHTPNALNEWLMKLRQQFPEGQIAVCLEQSRGPLIFHLIGYDFLTLFPVNPKTLARFREAFTASGAKGDSPDADFLRELVMLHHERLRPWKPDDEQSRTISFLAEGRRKAVDMRTKLVNKLRATLKMYFPQALALVGNSLASSMALDFLYKWPQLSDIQQARSKTVENFYIMHNSRSSAKIKERLHLIKTAIELTTDRAVIKSSLIAVKMLRAQIAQLNTSIDEYNHELSNVYDSHPDKDIFDSFPGAGSNLGPRLLSALPRSQPLSVSP